MLTYLLLLLGFALLIKGADLLVIRASAIGKRMHLSDIVIGLTIVSFGTSLPELLVNIMASFSGSSELAIGNVLGSNVANILLILGAAAIVRPLPIMRNTYFVEIPFSLTATLLVAIFANYHLFEESGNLFISRIDGGLLLLFFSVFMTYIYYVSKQKSALPSVEEVQHKALGESLLYIFIGTIGLYIGGKWVVEGAVTIASELGMSQTFIGLTVVAIGTSLPELATSMIAASKGNTNIAVGNAVGSNIFNVLWILGLSAVIKPLQYFSISNFDIVIIILASTMLMMAVVIGRRPVISRWEGIWFLLTYTAYMIFLVTRG